MSSKRGNLRKEKVDIKTKELRFRVFWIPVPAWTYEIETETILYKRKKVRVMAHSV